MYHIIVNMYLENLFPKEISVAMGDIKHKYTSNILTFSLTIVEALFF